VVFDPQLHAAQYARAVHQIHAVSGVMGEVLDSINVGSFSLEDYSARTNEYLDALGDDVDIWEVGNEINGEWLGESEQVSGKLVAAFDAVKERGKQTALTLYYNQHCFSRADHEMFAWTQKFVPEAMKSGLDYVLISYYPDDCKGPEPDWNGVFARLARMFPNSKVGFGECGTTDEAHKAQYIERYYGLKVNVPAYVGGYFWWYFRQDMLPYTAPLWSVLNDAIVKSP
jgi:hypothetical protein